MLNIAQWILCEVQYARCNAVYCGVWYVCIILCNVETLFEKKPSLYFFLLLLYISIFHCINYLLYILVLSMPLYPLLNHFHYYRYNIASIITLYIYLSIYTCYSCPCSLCIHFVSFLFPVSLYIYCVWLLYMILFVFLFCGLFWKIKSDDLSWFVLSILVIILIKYRWSYIIHTFEICQEMFVIYYWFLKINHYTIITIKERTRHDGLMSSDPTRSKHRPIQADILSRDTLL